MYIIVLLIQRGPTKIKVTNKKLFGTKIKANTCTNVVLGRLKKKEDGEITVLAISCVSLGRCICIG